MKFATCLMVAGLSAITASCGEFDEAGNPVGDTATDGTTDGEATETVTGALSIGNMHGGEVMYAGQRLVASQCYYHVRMQGDGNLVVYSGPTAATPRWASNTVLSHGAFAAMQRDGNLVVYAMGGTAKWASHTEGDSNVRLAMQNDGNLVLYKGTSAIWSSKTAGAVHSWPCEDAPQSETTFIEPGFDRPGSDYRSFTTTMNAHTCGAACAADNRCKSFTYVPSGIQDPSRAVCWLKTGTPAPVADSRGLVSGFKKFAASSN